MAVPIQPMEDYVVVKAEEVQSKTASGLYIPDSAQEKPKTAEVVAVGANVQNVKKGDKVLYKNEFEATGVKIGKAEYTIVHQKHIIATVK